MGNLKEAQDGIRTAERLEPGCAKAEYRLLQKAREEEQNSAIKTREMYRKMLASKAENIDSRQEDTPQVRQPSSCEIFQAKLRRFLQFRTDPPIKFD
mmetsp:Transcript_21405/g.34874  ORF Transcript_21405/g.34874 Transcript_21405/m.34874 type:complete len:97 (+) Transcript_21405:938-1228(+)